MPPPEPLEPLELTVGALRLRPWREDDLDEVWAAFQDPDIQLWNGGGVASRIDALATNDAQQWLIRDTLQSRDYDDIFAIGDCSACPQAELPATAAAITTRGSFSGRTVARRSFPGRSELAIGRTAMPLPLFFRIIRKRWRPLREKIAIQ